MSSLYFTLHPSCLRWNLYNFFIWDQRDCSWDKVTKNVFKPITSEPYVSWVSGTGKVLHSPCSVANRNNVEETKKTWKTIKRGGKRWNNYGECFTNCISTQLGRLKYSSAVQKPVIQVPSDGPVMQIEHINAFTHKSVWSTCTTPGQNVCSVAHRRLF